MINPSSLTHHANRARKMREGKMRAHNGPRYGAIVFADGTYRVIDLSERQAIDAIMADRARAVAYALGWDRNPNAVAWQGYAHDAAGQPVCLRGRRTLVNAAAEILATFGRAVG